MAGRGPGLQPALAVVCAARASGADSWPPAAGLPPGCLLQGRGSQQSHPAAQVAALVTPGAALPQVLWPVGHVGLLPCLDPTRGASSGPQEAGWAVPCGGRAAAPAGSRAAAASLGSAPAGRALCAAPPPDSVQPQLPVAPACSRPPAVREPGGDAQLPGLSTQEGAAEGAAMVEGRASHFSPRLGLGIKPWAQPAPGSLQGMILMEN